MVKAIVFDQDENTWVRFDSDDSTRTATSHEEVLPLLSDVQAHCESGGFAVGYVTYEAASAFDPALSHFDSDILPLAEFGFFGAPQPVDLCADALDICLSAEIDAHQFAESISQIKGYLAAGDTYQVNFTHQLRGEITTDPLKVFESLCSAQPSPYSVFFETDQVAICSVSPELFFEQRGKSLWAEPMKGTRPRGRYTQEDERLRQSLVDSEKDRAENLMIVDMIRNDLGRIANPGSVKTSDMFRIKSYPTVWQQVSSIAAETNANLPEIFSALFPCASVTGAPKNRTMEIIKELEIAPRGLYTGTIGLVGPNRQARFNVAIRTLTIDKKTRAASYGVGGGIVWDSDVEEEWQETVTKSRVLKFRGADFQLFETMRYEPDVGVSLLQYHLERLQRSAAYFDFVFDSEKVHEAVKEISSDDSLRLKLSLTDTGEISIEQSPAPDVGERFTLKLCSDPVSSQDVFLFHKTTRREIYDQAFQQRGSADDVILFNERGELTETTIANLYLEIDGELLTPTVDCGLLGGTYRQLLISEGRVREARLTKADLEWATKLYVSNAVRGLCEAEMIRV